MRELIKAPAAEPAIPDDRRACTVPQTAEMLGLSNVYLRVMLRRGDGSQHGWFEVVADDVECLAPATTASWQ